MRLFNKPRINKGRVFATMLTPALKIAGSRKILYFR
jgi:hypothetical protein